MNTKVTNNRQGTAQARKSAYSSSTSTSGVYDSPAHPNNDNSAAMAVAVTSYASSSSSCYSSSSSSSDSSSY